nr:hypothetical protein Iba_scaffold1367064CG0010 [Ipomoea batatas]
MFTTLIAQRRLPLNVNRGKKIYVLKMMLSILFSTMRIISVWLLVAIQMRKLAYFLCWNKFAVLKRKLFLKMRRFLLEV